MSGVLLLVVGLLLVPTLAIAPPPARLPDIGAVALAVLGLAAVAGAYMIARERTRRPLLTQLAEEGARATAMASRVEALEALFDASRALNSTLELPTVLEQILSSACELLDAAGGSIQLVCEDDPRMVEVVSATGPSGAVPGKRSFLEESWAGIAAQTDGALLVDSAGDLVDHTGPRAASIVVALRARNEVVGVLSLSAGQRTRPFDELDQRSVAFFGEIAAGVISTARSYADAEQAVAELTEMDAMKDDFLTMVSHELRTPLTGIIGVTSTIASNADRLDAEKVRQLAFTAREQGWQLEWLVNELLQTARGQNGILTLTPQSADVRSVVSNAVQALLSRGCAQHIRVVVPEEPIVSYVDTDLLMQIVMNLLDNAVKHTPPDTTISVGAAAHEDGVEVTVVDDGPGIAPERRERVFEKFQRGGRSSSSGGLGLGLYIVRMLAQAHGGTITAGEGPEGGAAFTVRLARLEGPSTVERPMATARRGGPG